MLKYFSLAALAVAVLVTISATAITTSEALTPLIVAPGPRTLYRSCTPPTQQQQHGAPESQLYKMQVPGYPVPFLVANITAADRFSGGYCWGKMLAEENVRNYQLLLARAFDNDKLDAEIFVLFADIQYKLFAAKYLPNDFKQELAGVAAGTAAAGYTNHSQFATTSLIMSSFPADIESNIKWLLINELGLGPKHLGEHEGKVVALHRRLHAAGHTSPSARHRKILIALQRARDTYTRSCSHWGAWGSRSQGSNLFSGRNLDWLSKSGIANASLVTFWHLPDAISSASVGFAGLAGLVAGISKAGSVVTESGQTSMSETLEGFSWTLRLRALMQSSNATTMDGMVGWWKSTKNTMAMAHGISGTVKGKHQFMELEVNANATAFFRDDDPREADFAVEQPENCDASGNWIPGTGPCKHVGAPMKEAVFRTNFVVDPQQRRLQVPGTRNKAGVARPGSDSFTRYMLIAETLREYERSNVTIGALEAVNITAVAAGKGRISRQTASNPSSGFGRLVTCPAGPTGTNIVSVAFQSDPAPKMWLAYEIFTPQLGHHVAACNSYVDFPLQDFGF